MHLFYIHGFLSGPNAAKATALASYLKDHPELASSFSFSAPDFPDEPEPAFTSLQAQLVAFVKEHPQEPIGLIGSSMGGFFSTLLTAQLACPAVLLNPCVAPQEYFPKLIGPQFNPVTQRHFELKSEMMTYLAYLDNLTVVRPELIKVILADQDEVLDKRKSELLYNACDISIINGEDHAFTRNFKALIPEIFSFFQNFYH